MVILGRTVSLVPDIVADPSIDANFRFCFDMIISDYFLSIERGLRQNTSVSSIEVEEALASDEYNGLLRCRAHFWDGSILNIHEAVSTELGYPVRIVRIYIFA